MDTVTDQLPSVASELFDAEAAKADLDHIASDYGGHEHELRLVVAQRLKTALAEGRARAEQLLFEDRQGRACAVRLSQMQDAIIRVLYEFATTHLYAA
jgi:[protein-PII] uridylyltransferase